MVVILRDRRLTAYGLVAAAGLVLGVAIARIGFAITVLLPLALGVMLLLVTLGRLGAGLESDAERRRLKWWTIVSLVAHFAAGVVIASTSLTYYLGPDAAGYHIGATQIYNHWVDGSEITQLIPRGKEGFYNVLAAVYWLFGPSRYAGIALNAVLAAALVPLLTDTTRRLFGPSAARYMPPMAVVMPGLFVWTAQLLKEACILFLIALAINFAVRVTERFSPLALIGMTASLAALLTFRSQIGLVIAAGTLLGLVFSTRSVLRGLRTGVPAVAVSALIVLALGLGYAGLNVALNTDLERADMVRRDLSETANSGFAAEADVSTARGALAYLPTGFMAFFFGPLPWQVTSVRALPALGDALAWWYLLPSLWRGQRVGRRVFPRKLRLLILPAAATSIVLSLSAGNFGIIVRERAQVVVLLLPIIAFGLSQRSTGAGDVAGQGDESIASEQPADSPRRERQALPG